MCSETQRNGQQHSQPLVTFQFQLSVEDTIRIPQLNFQFQLSVEDTILFWVLFCGVLLFVICADTNYSIHKSS
jgi:hypothetical protein